MYDYHDESISVLISRKHKVKNLPEFYPLPKDHSLGKVVNVPVSSIREIKAWKRGKPAKGALMGAGTGLMVSGILAITYDDSQDSGSGYIPSTKPIVLAASSVFIVPFFSTIGAAITGGKKEFSKFKILGSQVQYEHNKNKLKMYALPAQVR